MKNLSKSQLDNIFLNMINQLNEGVLIVDATQKGLPIISANRGFYKITGYKPDEVIGKNPKFLSGKDTDTVTQGLIRDCINKKQNGSFTICNYKKDGTKFWNHFTITPIFDNQHNLTHWVGIERDISLILEIANNKSKSQSMVTTINTLSDVINNFLNYFSYFKQECESNPNVDKELLTELDDVYEKFINDIRLLYMAVKYKDKNLGGDFSVLDIE
jgi:PAS domain S-box-containing protein